MSGVQVKSKTYIFNNQSMGASADSDAQLSYQVAEGTIYVWWENGSTPVGEIRLQANVVPKGEKPKVWKTLTLDSTANVTGNSGNLEITIGKPLSEFRLQYIRSSGDGELYATWEGRSKG